MALAFVDPNHYDELQNDLPGDQPTKSHRTSRTRRSMTNALATPTSTALTTLFAHDIKDMIGRNIMSYKKHHSNYYYKLSDQKKK